MIPNIINYIVNIAIILQYQYIVPHPCSKDL
jgi:hypothetical protein